MTVTPSAWALQPHSQTCDVADVALDPAQTACRAGDVDQVLARRSGSRLREVVSQLDVGEQTIGSHHQFAVLPPAPATTGDMPALAFVAASGDPEFRASWSDIKNPMSAQSEGAGAFATPITVTFAPTHKGPRHGTAVLNARWLGGTTEAHRIALVGRGRAIDELPTMEASPGEAAANAAKLAADQRVQAGVDAELVAESKRTDVPAYHDDGDLHVALEKAKSAVETVGSMQANGVRRMKGEALRFTPEIHHDFGFEDLLQIALVLGTAGVTKLIVASLEPALAVVVKAIQREEQAVVLGIGPGAKLAAQTAAKAAGGAEKATVEAVREQESVFVQGLASGTEDGMKKAAELGLAQVRGSHKSEPGMKPAERAKLADDFFQSQEDALSLRQQLDRDNITDLHARLTPLLRVDPKAAVSVVHALTAAFDVAKVAAPASQTAATASSWVSFVARGALGTGNVPGTTTVVTNVTASMHRDSPLAPPDVPDGLLDIHTRTTGDEQIVDGVFMRGVSQTTADRLLRMPLGSTGIPLRISINDATWITRDEAGRVRVSGSMLNPEYRNEAQAQRAAEDYVHRLLEKTLMQRGVARVTTNDANGE